MRLSSKGVLVSLVAVAALLMPLTAGAQTVGDAVSTFTYTKNMKPQGYSPRVVPLTGAGSGVYNSDIAFWGKTAYQGNYSGFRIVDVSDPENPVQITNYDQCSPGSTQGNQGDVIVWENLLVRSWNSPATATSTCDGELVGAGFEGLHVFDISDPSDPDLVGSVAMDGLPNLVTIASGSAAGQYEAAGAAFGPAPTAAGVTGTVVLSNDGVGTATDGCEPLVGFPAGSIAVVDRGTCEFGLKALNAQNAGAVGVIVANNAPGIPGTMGAGLVGNLVTISAVQVSQADGAIIKSGLPASGTISRNAEFGCGSHTATGVPDLENDRLLVYNSSSAGGTCDFFEIVEVPLDDPGSARVINRVDSMHTCHDIGVILGDAMRLACAGGEGARIFSLDPADGASLTNPVLMHHFDIPGRDHRPLGRLELGRRGAHLRPRAGRRHAGALPGDERPGGSHALLLRPRRQPARDLRPPTPADGDGELHLAQLQRRAHGQRQDPRRRQLPVRDQRARLHRPRKRAGDRLRGSGPADQSGQPRRHRGWRRLVVLLV